MQYHALVGACALEDRQQLNLNHNLHPELKLLTCQHNDSVFQKFYTSWSRGLGLSSTKASVLTTVAMWIGVGSEAGRGP